MSNVLPRRNLPGKADAWGREIEANLKGLDANRVQLEQAVNNGFRATAGQLAVTARQLAVIDRQQAELAGRVSYAAETDLGGTANTATGIYPLSGATVSFTLDRSRVVKITTSFNGQVTTGTSTSGASYAYLMNYVDGSAVGTWLSRGSMYANIDVAFRGSISTTSLVTLPAGTHTVYPALDYTRSSSSGSVIRYSASTVVDVLQPSS